MKLKKIFLSIILLSVLSVPADAMNFMIGAKGGYYEWKPYFEDMGGFFGPGKRGTGVMYGMAMSALFTPDFSFSISGLTGKQSSSWTMDMEAEEEPDDIRAGTYSWSGRRYDLDSALSYRLFAQLKVILGYKVQYIDSTLRQTEGRRSDTSTQLSQLNHSKDTIKTLSHGPAVGLGYAFIFGESFFAAANLSFIYMRGYFEVEMDYGYTVNADGAGEDEWEENSEGMAVKVDISQVGLNFEPTLGYKPSANGLIFTLGLRYQWLQTKFEDLTPNEKEELGAKTMNDYQYGIYISVIYSI